VVVSILVPFAFETAKTIEDFKSRLPQGYQWPNLEDFSVLTGLSAMNFFFLENWFLSIAYPFYYPYCKEKKDPVVRDLRTKKAVKNLFKVFYYLFATVFGYITIKDTNFLPVELGGRGSIYNTYEGYPYV
jgi:hypothetical protein